MPLGHHVLPDSMIRDDISRKNMGDDYDKKETYAEASNTIIDRGKTVAYARQKIKS